MGCREELLPVVVLVTPTGSTQAKPAQFPSGGIGADYLIGDNFCRDCPQRLVRWCRRIRIAAGIRQMLVRSDQQLRSRGVGGTGGHGGGEHCSPNYPAGTGQKAQQTVCFWKEPLLLSRGSSCSAQSLACCCRTGLAGCIRR